MEKIRSIAAKWNTPKWIAVRALVFFMVASFAVYFVLMGADTNGITHFDWIVLNP